MTYKPTNDTASEPGSGEVWYFSNGVAATIMDRKTAQTDPTDKRTKFTYGENGGPKPVRRVRVY